MFFFELDLEPIKKRLESEKSLSYITIAMKYHYEHDMPLLLAEIEKLRKVAACADALLDEINEFDGLTGDENFNALQDALLKVQKRSE